MISMLPSLFGRQSIDLFSQMAETITTEYVEDIAQNIVENGLEPSFEELMFKVKALNNELAMKAIWLRDNYSNERGRKSAKLTRACKKIIKKSNDDFLRTVKVIIAQKNRKPLNSVYLLNNGI
jgi:hypothetical protein